ncbi:MAG: GNAT family N-acetyltransferase [Clostridiales bacterium]|nr:GNAT family N-acetyltransferase [Clostridiales bacterium]
MHIAYKGVTQGISLQRIHSDSENLKKSAALISALAEEIWREHYLPLIGAAQVDYMLAKYQSPTQIFEDITVNGYTYYVAVLNDNSKASALPGSTAMMSEAIGYAACQPRDGYLFLSKLYVRKDCRRQGVAHLFLNAAKSLCQEYGLDRIRLTVNKNNAGSVAAYGKLGFNRIDSVVTDIGGGFVMDDYIMELSGFTIHNPRAGLEI